MGGIPLQRTDECQSMTSNVAIARPYRTIYSHKRHVFQFLCGVLLTANESRETYAYLSGSYSRGKIGS